MSTNVKTVEGDYFESGFWGADTTQVMLGELPSISIEEFGAYAKEAVLAFIPLLSVEDFKAAGQLIKFTRDLLASVSVRTIPSPYTGLEDPESVTHDFVKAHGDLQSALAAEGLAKAFGRTRGHLSIHYASNPFIVRQETVIIGGRHETSHIEFLLSALDHFEGGTFGWHPELGAPQTVHDAVREIDEAYKTHETSRT